MQKYIVRWFLFLCVMLLCFFSVAVITEQKQQQSKYTLSVYQGRLAVFEGDRSQPFEIFDTRVSSLPAEEAEKLYEGVGAQTAEELQSLIEDYCS